AGAAACRPGLLPGGEGGVAEPEEIPSDQLKRCAEEGGIAYPRGHTRGGRGGEPPLRVVLPDSPPRLTPQAARAFLQIIRTACAQQAAADEHRPPCAVEGERTDGGNPDRRP